MQGFLPIAKDAGPSDRYDCARRTDHRAGHALEHFEAPYRISHETDF